MNDLSEFVTLHESTLVTDSLRIAKHFGKRHDDVLKAIRMLVAQLPVDHVRNFAETVIERPNPSSGAPIHSPAYRLTRDGFTLLAMGFTGKKALTFKLAYIDAFNKMEAQLHHIGMSLWNQRLELEKKDATSFMWASFGAKRMLDRRRELPVLKKTREQLLHEMEPALFGGSELLN